MASKLPELHKQPIADAIKVVFKFVPREDWLPYDREGLWAIRVGADSARIKNVAFLQDGVAMDDIVRFNTDPQGIHWAIGSIAPSGRCVIRVVPFPDGPLGASAQAVHREFASFGIGGESFSEEFPMVAFDVPAEADFPGIKRLLERGQEHGWWDYEVGCGTAAWWDAEA